MTTLTAGDPNQRNRLERSATNRRGLWWALGLEILGLLLFVLIFNFVVPTLGANLSTPARTALGLFFSLIPAALWLLFFYGFDRAEPEPKRMVLLAFAGGAVLFAALSTPVLQAFFQIDRWLYASDWSRLLGGILVVGVVEQYIVFLAVRYLAFEHPEFDERVDGVIYAVAAGLGVATVINFQYVIARGGVDLDIGSVRMVVNTLAYASFGGVLGYFIGQARFERVPWYYLPGGLLLAAAMNGLLFFLLEERSTGLQAQKPWDDLLLAAVLALVALVAVFLLVARANEETLRVARGAGPRPATPRRRDVTPGRAPYPGAFVGAPVAASVGGPEEAEPPIADRATSDRATSDRATSDHDAPLSSPALDALAEQGPPVDLPPPLPPDMPPDLPPEGASPEPPAASSRLPEKGDPQGGI